MFLDILIALLILNIMIIAHELGHFIFAKRNGIEVEEFGIGFGPTLWQKQWNGTNWVIKLFPLGGYNGIKGETEAEDGKGNFVNASKKARLKVLFAGSGMNLIVSVIAFYIYILLLGFKVPIPIEMKPLGGSLTSIGDSLPVITAYTANSPASKLNIAPPYYVKSINNNSVRMSEDVVRLIAQSTSKDLEIELVKEGKTYNVKLQKDEDGKIGIMLNNPPVQIDYSNNFATKLLSGVSHTVNTTVMSGQIIGRIVKYSVVNKDSEPIGYLFSGPVAIVAAVGAVVEDSKTVIADLANMTGLIGVSLAIFNMLPFPGLDGWHIFLVFYEKARGRKPNQSLVQKVTAIGLLLLMLLGVVIIVKDVILFFVK